MLHLNRRKNEAAEAHYYEGITGSKKKFSSGSPKTEVLLTFCLCKLGGPEEKELTFLLANELPSAQPSVLYTKTGQCFVHNETALPDFQLTEYWSMRKCCGEHFSNHAI
ncbi:hypothetical protein E2C01_020959 [Portunus trituberculatus]|uniref:Uncharacterized protein n=1 Tax=Portunus trituberculatus TaxID=210409 RepID=A0A5B7E3P4_PORTR|nr:hypothetical protein [Portunus trituberculatus]